MKLREYLKEKSLSQAAFGRLLCPPVSQGKVNHWLSGTRRVSLAEALQIERVTGGAVSIEELADLHTGVPLSASGAGPFQAQVGQGG